MSKRERREQGSTPDPTEPRDDGPTANFYAIKQEPGRGWTLCVVALPRAEVERYAVEVSEPEILSIQLAKIVQRIEREAIGR